MFKAIGRIGKEKTTFDVVVKPCDVQIYTTQSFALKLSIQRGKQDAVETKEKQVTRSVRATDIKTVTFDESFNFPCTFFIKDGVPEVKTCLMQLIRVNPDGKDTVFAKKEVNLALCFGDQFEMQNVDMELTKQAQGVKVKGFSYESKITCKD